MRPSTRTVATLLFASGFAALIYQTEWQRTFRLVFGASTGASAAVLGIFLGGLGLGGMLLGKRAERSERPLSFYGNLEVLIAFSAALTPLLAKLAASVYFSVGGSRTLGFFGATCLRLVLAALVIGPATVLMGGTLPAAARAVQRDDDVGRGSVATIYAFNTAGAVLGALLGTFVLFQLFGNQITLWIACLLNLLVAVIARALGRDSELVSAAEANDAVSVRDDEAGLPPQRMIYVTAAVLGFAFLLLEMVWYRMLGPILGGSTYTFGLILALALLGIGLGAFAYSRRLSTAPATLSQLALTLGLEALFTAVPLLAGDDVALFTAYTRRMEAMGVGGLFFSWFLTTSIVVLPAAVVSGYQFPLILALLGRGKRRVAEQVGRLYAFNTLGSIAGAILTGFCLIPKIGAVATWRLAVGLLAALALGFLARALFRERPFRAGALAVGFGAAATSLVAFGVTGPTAVWRHTPIGADRVRIDQYDRNGLRDWEQMMRREVVWERDGIESSVALLNQQGYAFVVNGKTDGNVVNDRPTQAMVGLLPALLHPNPRSAFVIGLGTGTTAGLLGKVDSIEHVDVAELEPMILNVARVASPANGAVLDNPKVSIFSGDGREFMLTSSQQYDVISSEPSNPYRAGIASLFTTEFYQVIAAHLKPDGLFAQWVQGYEIDVESVRVVLKTLRSVFPSVEAWFTMNDDFLLIAAKTPHVYDTAMIQSRLGQAPYRETIPRVWLTESVAGIFSHFVADNAAVAQVSDLVGVATNSDDLNFLEYAFARNIGREGADTVGLLLKAATASGHARAPVAGDVDWELVDELRGRSSLSHDTPSATPLNPAAATREQFIEQGCLGGKLAGAVELWRKQPQIEPRDVVEVFVLGRIFASTGDKRALDSADALAARGYVAESLLIKARFLVQNNRTDEAMSTLEAAFAELRREVFTLCSTSSHLLTLAIQIGSTSPELAHRAAVALMDPFELDDVDGLRRGVLEHLAFLSNDAELCVRALGRDLLVPHWTEMSLRERLSCLESAHHPLTERARDDLLEFLEGTPGTFE